MSQIKVLNDYMKANPHVSREQAIQLLFRGGDTQRLGKGVSVEKSDKKVINLQSGRKIVIENGERKYFSANGIQLVEKYFEQQEGKIDVRPSGRYAVTKNRQTKYYSADGTELKPEYFKEQEFDIKVAVNGKKYNLNATIKARIKALEQKLKNAEKDNGFIGKSWDWVKNTAHIGDSSDDVREQLKQEKKLLAQLDKDPTKCKTVFKQLTGADYNSENIKKFIEGKTLNLKSATSLKDYKEGQDMAVETVSDIGAGVVGTVTFLGALAAAPETAGGSLMLWGAGMAAVTGAVTKSSVKQADTESAGRVYTPEEQLNDYKKGAAAGFLGTMGGIGTSVESAVTKTTTKYLGTTVGNIVAKTAGYSAEGGVIGGLDMGYRTAVDGGSAQDVLNSTLEGTAYGAVFGPAMCWGARAVGRGMQAAKNAATNSNIENILVRDIDVETLLPKIKNHFNNNTKYDNDAVKSLTEAVNSTNAPFLDAALDILKTNKNANYANILQAMGCINEQNMQFSLSILKNKNVYPLAWGAVLKNADNITIPEFQVLLKNKAFCKKHLMNLEFINKDNIDLYKMYYNDERFSGGSYKLTNLLAPVNQYNKSYLKTVLEQAKKLDSSFTVNVGKMLEPINNDLRKSIADKIIPANINDIGKFDFPYITNIISTVNKKNKAFLSGCIDSKKFSMSELSNIMNIYNIDMSVRPDVLKTNRLLEQLNNLSDDAKRALVSDGLDLSAIEKYLRGEYTVTPTTSGGRTKLFKNVIANNNENALLTTDFSVSTNNGVKEIIDDICSGLPEFRAIANSPHGVKTLQTLQSFMKSSEYKTFSDAEKTIGKLSILLSSLKESPDAILSRYKFDNSMKSRIINIVRNKELITDCLNGKVSEKNVVANFRNIADYKIAEHIIKANPANSAKFTVGYSQNINVAFNEFYSGQKFLFTSHILNNGKDFPTVNYSGKDIKVLNLSNMSPDEDLAKYGFPSGTTRENVTFDVHMTNNAYGTSEAQDIETMLKLSNDQFRDFVPSSTLIKGNKNSTFMGYRYGIILKNDQMNIGTLGFDSVTGLKKGSESFARLIFGTESSKAYRDMFMDALAKNSVTITEQEYAQLAKQIQSAKYLTQIHDIKIGDKSIKAEQIKEAVNECTNQILESEVTSFNPGIEALYAKVGSLDECPKDFVELAAKYNLPIVLQKSAETSGVKVVDNAFASKLDDVVPVPTAKPKATPEYGVDEFGQVHLKNGAEPVKTKVEIIGKLEDGQPIIKEADDNALAAKKKALKAKILAQQQANSQIASNVAEPIPKGYVRDTKTGKLVKVDINKIRTEVNQTGVNIYDEFGNKLGGVLYDGVVESPNGQKTLHFQGLGSEVEGLGIGTRLINELKKISQDKGCGGRLIAEASPSKVENRGSRPMTNLGFYYKAGFKAVDPEMHAKILECINNNIEIPIRLNHDVLIELY